MVSAHYDGKQGLTTVLKGCHIFRLGSMAQWLLNICLLLICKSWKKVKNQAAITMSSPFHCSLATTRTFSIQKESSGFCLREPQNFHDLFCVSWCACCLLKANINCTEIFISWQFLYQTNKALAPLERRPMTWFHVGWGAFKLQSSAETANTNRMLAPFYCRSPINLVPKVTARENTGVFGTLNIYQI